MTLPNKTPNYNQVGIKFFLRVLLEQWALGNHRTVWLMIENVKFDDNYATWERGDL